MRKLAFILLVIISFFACATERAQDLASNSVDVSYEIDTVRIDAKGEFLYLNWGLFMSDYDPNTGLLYNLNPQTSRMEVIDLEKNELNELVQYDQDGPNAVKEMFTSGIKITDIGEKWFSDYYSLFHLNASGQKIEQFRLTNEALAGDTLPDGFEIDGMGKFSRSGQYFVSHYGNFQPGEKGPQGLAVIDLKARTKKLISMDVFESLEKYKLFAQDVERAGVSAPERSVISLTDQEIVHSNNAQNRLRVLDFGTGEQREILLKSALLLDEKPGNYPKNANSMEQFYEFSEMKMQELTFGPWVFDPERQHHWRVSRFKNGGSVSDPTFAFVVTVLDREFRQISEIQLADGERLPFEGLPSVSFFREGMLYMFLNMEDELAFVRFKPVLGY